MLSSALDVGWGRREVGVACGHTDTDSDTDTDTDTDSDTDTDTDTDTDSDTDSDTLSLSTLGRVPVQYSIFFACGAQIEYHFKVPDQTTTTE
jgi:hypothetical protein